MKGSRTQARAAEAEPAQLKSKKGIPRPSKITAEPTRKFKGMDYKLNPVMWPLYGSCLLYY